MGRAALLRGVFAALLLAGAVPAPAASTDGATPVPLEATVAEVKSDTEEEIIVKGHLQRLSEVRQAILEAEDRFYNRYNELNPDPAFDITCRFEPPTGSRLPIRSCEAGYMTDARRESAMALFRAAADTNLRLLGNSGIANTLLSELQRRMRRIAETDAEVQRAMVEQALLKERYRVLRERKFNGRQVVWD